MNIERTTQPRSNSIHDSLLTIISEDSENKKLARQFLDRILKRHYGGSLLECPFNDSVSMQLFEIYKRVNYSDEAIEAFCCTLQNVLIEIHRNKRAAIKSDTPVIKTKAEPKKDKADLLGLTDVTFDILLKEKDSANLLLLYMFYCRTAKRQETKQVWATSTFAAKGLVWSERKVKYAKKRLKELGLIESVVRKDNKERIKNHYIKVNYIKSNDSATECTLDTTQSAKNPQCNVLHTNAYILLKKNAKDNCNIENFQFSKETSDDSSRNEQLHSYRPVKQLSSSQIQAPLAEAKLIEYWNSLPNVIKVSPKTYKKVSRAISTLTDGSYKKKSYDAESKKSYTFPELFSDAEIKLGMDYLSRLLTPGYWPPDKKPIKRSLFELIYNSRTQKSWFLEVMKSPPKLLSEVSSCNSQFKAIAEKFCTDYELTELNKAVKLLIGVEN